MTDQTAASPRTLTAREVFDRAAAAEQAGDPAEAERLVRIALTVAGAPDMIGSLAIALNQQGRFDEAIRLQRAVTEIAPDPQPHLFALAIDLLRQGEYREGFQLYETRGKRITSSMSGPPTLSFPEWRGEPVTRLVIFPEQGLGDELMFNRYLPVLQARGVRVALLCRPTFARVFDKLGAYLVPIGPSVDVPRGDAWVFSGSLPHLMGTTVETVPPAVYLSGKAGGKGIGVMATGRMDPDPRRSLPPELAAELLGLPGAVSLNPADTGAKDFEDTRRIVEELELVITVDTAMAHLAGAMGKACWTLLPFVHDWRWGPKGDRSPWYPEMRLFRQPRLLDWRSVVDEVKAAAAARG